MKEAELDQEIAACLDNPVAGAVLDAVESYALILNEHRQILAANAALFCALAVEDPVCFQGLRPGEVLKCVHVEEGPDGCGTSRACGRCGAVLTILAARKQGCPVEGECLLGSSQGGKWDAREFWVRATPLRIAGHEFLALVMRDISAQKRREALEQVFLHDLTPFSPIGAAPDGNWRSHRLRRDSGSSAMPASSTAFSSTWPSTPWRPRLPAAG